MAKTKKHDKQRKIGVQEWGRREAPKNVAPQTPQDAAMPVWQVWGTLFWGLNRTSNRWVVGYRSVLGQPASGKCRHPSLAIPFNEMENVGNHSPNLSVAGFLCAGLRLAAMPNSGFMSESAKSETLAVNQPYGGHVVGIARRYFQQVSSLLRFWFWWGQIYSKNHISKFFFKKKPEGPRLRVLLIHITLNKNHPSFLNGGILAAKIAIHPNKKNFSQNVAHNETLYLLCRIK